MALSSCAPKLLLAFLVLPFFATLTVAQNKTFITKAVIVMSQAGSVSGISGQIYFDQPTPTSPVSLNVRLSGFAPLSTHGCHIHRDGDLTVGGTSTGPHFNPLNATHGGPEDPEDKRHMGDLGNIVSDGNGTFNGNVTFSYLTLNGVNSIVGRALVIHADKDDLGKGTYNDSLINGHSGARIAYGVIGIATNGTGTLP